MSKQGSEQFTWKRHNLSPNEHFCPWCGAKLRIEDVGWVTCLEDKDRVAHFQCELEHRKAA